MKGYVHIFHSTPETRAIATNCAQTKRAMINELPIANCWQTYLKRTPERTVLVETVVEGVLE